MSDIRFDVSTTWSGTGKNGQGEVTIGDESLTFSGPSAMGGKGVGVSPEDLLIAGVTTCYSGTLFSILKRKKLSVQDVMVKAEGVVTDYPLKAKFSQLVVHPTIVGGDQSNQKAYEEAAHEAREKCFVGKTISGNVTYEVGTVQISN